MTIIINIIINNDNNDKAEDSKRSQRASEPPRPSPHRTARKYEPVAGTAIRLLKKPVNFI